MVSTTTKLFHLATRLWVTGHAHLSNSISTFIWLPHPTPPPPRLWAPLSHSSRNQKRANPPSRHRISYSLLSFRISHLDHQHHHHHLRHPTSTSRFRTLSPLFSRSFRLLFQQTNCLAYIQSSLNVGLSRRPSFPSPSIIVFISVILEITRSPALYRGGHSRSFASLCPHFPFPSLPHES